MNSSVLYLSRSFGMEKEAKETSSARTSSKNKEILKSGLCALLRLVIVHQITGTWH